MSDFHNKRAAEIINNIFYITIASVSNDGQPWNSPVYSGFDQNLNFYWSSDKNGQHSKNVRDNGRIFLVIYDSTAPESTGEGVYIQAEAEELKRNDEIQEARRVTQIRKGQLDELSDKDYEKFTGTAVRRVYKAIPKRIWMNDVEIDRNHKYIRDTRVEVPLDKLKLLV